MVLNIPRAKATMQKHGVDAIIAASPSNIAYVTDFASVGHSAMRDEVYALLPREGIEESSTIILPMGDARDYISDLRSGITSIPDVRPFGSYTIYSRPGVETEPVEAETLTLMEKARGKKPVQVLIQALKEKRLDRAKVAIDDQLMPISSFDEMRQTIGKELPDVTFVRGTKIIKEIRMVKTKEEVARLRKAATITERAFESAVSDLADGMEVDAVIRSLMAMMVEEGGMIRGSLYPTLGFGRKSYLQNCAHPAVGRLRRGDLIRFDGGCSFRYYCADIARNAVFGEPSDKIRRYYSAVLAGEQAIIDNARPGIRASELYRISMDAIRKEWIPDFQRSHCGHTIGVEVYDGIMIAPNDDTPIEEGMVLNPETPYDEFGLGKFHVEDPVLVTAGKPEVLTEGHRELLVI